EDQRILSERDRYLANFTLRKMFLAHDAAVFAGRDIETQRVLVVDHHTVSSQIYPTLVGIASDIHGAGPDIPAAVQLVPFRGRELPHVDVLAPKDVLHYRAIFDYLRFDVLDVGDAILDLPDELEACVIGGHSQRHGQTLGGVQRV